MKRIHKEKNLQKSLAKLQSCSFIDRAICKKIFFVLPLKQELEAN